MTAKLLINNIRQNRAPYFLTDTRNVIVEENSTGVVFTARAIDPDGNTLFYSLSGGPDKDLFTINSTTGEATLISPPNYEDKRKYEVIVTASDGFLVATQTFIIDVGDLPENSAPYFSQGTRSVSFPENSHGVVLTVKATDSENDLLTYRLVSGDISNINLNATTGEIRFISSPNFEAKSSYTFVVEASDGFLTDTQTITIPIIDVYEPPPNRAPIITSAASYSFEEGGTGVVFTATATDADGDAITYSVRGTDSSSVSIGSVSGQATFNTSPVHSEKSRYVIQLVVRDARGLYAYQNIAINITEKAVPINTAPVITSSSIYSYAENGTGSVFTATATDPDGDALRWGKTTYGDSAYFNVTSRGVVSFKVSPDYEIKQSYTLQISVTDTHGNTTYKTITINITNVVEIVNRKPVLNVNAQYSYAENGTGHVFTATATDADGDNLVFSLYGTHSAYLTIGPETGVVDFINSPDFEVKNVYIFGVKVTDGTLSALQATRINITDKNESKYSAAIDSQITKAKNAETKVAGYKATAITKGGELSKLAKGLASVTLSEAQRRSGVASGLMAEMNKLSDDADKQAALATKARNSAKSLNGGTEVSEAKNAAINAEKMADDIDDLIVIARADAAAISAAVIRLLNINYP